MDHIEEVFRRHADKEPIGGGCYVLWMDKDKFRAAVAEILEGERKKCNCYKGDRIHHLPDCPANEDAFYRAIQAFQWNRGRHDGEHDSSLTVCSKCNEAYVLAESKLDEALAHAPTTPIAQEVFTVERNNGGTLAVSNEPRWDVVGPDGVAEAISYANKEDAQYLADALNAAYRLGADQRDTQRESGKDRK